ncbi:MAG TPA: dihydrolipoamide acetyltransferase family protein [Thermoplasmata archaeon]|nr:dihydrolipoamide acetyltransferase family protein [Thermoplasmata archaeon]
MTKEFHLPDIGEGVSEGEIVKWLVKEGDPIKEEQLMVEVMTDKATVQIPSPWTGKVAKLLAKEGEIVKTGAAIIVIEEVGGTTAAAKPAPVPAPVTPTAAPPSTSAPAGEVLATPAVRKLARELSVDLTAVRGSGPGGRVTDDDVRAAKSAPPAARAPPAPARVTELVAPAAHAPKGGVEERVPLVGLRKRISEKMHKSKTTAAHFTYVEEVDMTAVIHLRQKAAETAAKRGVKLTYLPFIVKAVVTALKQHPFLNATLDEARSEVVVKKYYNVGIATATDEGLTVVVLHDADKLDLWQIGSEIDRLATAARQKTIRLEDLSGSTFTITSLGVMGGVFATPIINFPEVAILGIHKIEKRAVVRDDVIVIRDMMYLSCAFDHRVVDGHVGAAFVHTLKEYLEHPALLFMHG